MSVFEDRAHAGRVLARKLADLAGRPDVLVLALPRGGVPVAYEVAHELKAPLDVFNVRKLGVPGHEELALGAIATGGVRVINEDVVQALRIGDQVIEQVTEAHRGELALRERLYRDDRPPPDVRGRTVILVDDGLATGTTMRAAVAALSRLGPAAIIVAVPAAAGDSRARLGYEVADVVSVLHREVYFGVGFWYDDFRQVTDAEVRDLLDRAARELAGEAPA
jgi:predicted phosphoribosyltransferase